MNRDPNAIHSYQHVLISSANDVAVYRQLKKLEQKKFHLMRRIERFERMAKKDTAELKMLDTRMIQLQEKVRPIDV